MGIIIIDGRTAFIFKGPISKFENVIVGLRKLQEELSGIKIEVKPYALAAGGIIVDWHSICPISEFEKMVVRLEMLHEKWGLDTFPLLPEGPQPPSPPGMPKTPLRFVISAYTKVE